MAAARPRGGSAGRLDFGVVDWCAGPSSGPTPVLEGTSPGGQWSAGGPIARTTAFSVRGPASERQPAKDLLGWSDLA